MHTFAPKLRPHPIAAAAIAAIGLTSAQAAPVTWLAGGTFWDLATSWDVGVPGVADDALLGGFASTFRSGVVTIRSFSGTGTLSVTGGQLAVTNASSTNGLTMSQGSLGGTGNITVTGAANLTFGDMRGTGTTFLQGATTISSSGFRLDGGRVLNNSGTLTWSGGQLLFNNTFNGANGGAGSGTINNVAGATFIAGGDSAANILASNFGGVDTGADATINNAGTFRKSGSGAANLTTVDVIFNNTGTVQAQTGVLNLTSGGTHTGNFDVSAGAVLGFGGGTHNINAGTITSPGTVRVSGTTVVNLNTAYGIAGTTEIQSGSLNLLGGNATTGALTQSSGSVAGSNNLTVSGAATITFGDHRGTGTTFLQGATTISSSGFRLDGGRVLNNSDTLTWSGGQLLFNNTFNGASGGAGSGTINNVAGATFIAGGDSAANILASNFGGVDTGADATINNAGTFRKSGSGAANVTTVDVIFNNSGAVQAQTGVLNLTNGGTHSGNFDVAAGAVLGFGGGTHNINAGTITSPGTVRVSGTAVVNLNTAYAVAGTTEIQSGSLNLLGGNATTGALTQSSGSVAGSNNLTVSGAATITFGDHRGTGTTFLQGATTIASSGFRLDGGRVLNNSGTLTWSGGQLLFNNTFNGANGGAGSGTINNVAGATFIAGGDSAANILASNFGGVDTGADATINNAGTFRKSGSGAANLTTVDVIFNNTGTVQAQTGVLNLTSGGTHTGNFDVSAGAVLGFGGGTHNINAGTITSPGTVRVSGTAVVNLNTAYAVAGTTEIQSGSLNLLGGNATTGALTQSSGSVAGSNNLTVSGAATITFGDHRGTGTTFLQGATTISSSGFRLDGGRVLSNSGTLTWSGGQLLFNNNVSGTAIAGSGTINNVSGGTFIANGDSVSSIAASNFGGVDTGADAAINNAGTFRKSGSGAANVTNVAVAFNNTGTIDVQTGQLQFGSGGVLTHSGVVNVAAGASLDFASAGTTTHTINTASTTIAGTLSITGDNILNFSTAHTLGGTGTFQHSFGQVTGASLILGPSLSAAFTDGAHSGAATTTVRGTASIAGLRLDGERIFRNEGTVTQTGNVDMNSRRTGIAAAGNGTVVNASGATWNAGAAGTNFIFASNQGVGDTGAGAVFTNAGTFNKVGAGITDVRTSLVNTGSLNVQSGQLQFSSGGALTHSGVLTIANGAVLDFASAGATTQTINTTGTTIAGTLSITGDNIVNFSTAHVLGGTGTFQHNFGQVTGANLTLGPTINSVFGDGGHSGAATTTVQGTASIASLRLDGERIFRNEGTVTQTGNVDMNSRRTGIAEAGSGTVVNASGATWNAGAAGTNFIFASNQGVGDTGAGAVFTNAGTFNKVGAGVTDVRTSLVNTGSLNVQSGQLQFGSGGALTHSGVLTIANGAVLDFASAGATTQTINTASTTIAGTLSITGDNFVNFSTAHVLGGTGTFQHNFGQVTGANLTLGPTINAVFGDGGHSGAATTTVQGTASIAGLRLDGERIFRNEGTVTQTGNIDMNSRRTGIAVAGNGTVVNASGATWNAGAAGTNFIFTSNQGVGDTGAGAVFTNAGTFNKVGAGTTDVRTGFNNSGLVDVQSGTLSLQAGITGNTGTLQTSGGTVLVQATSSTGNLFHNSNAANSLNLGTQTITVFSDYNNANFGSGNAFNRRANVATTGTGARLLAGGDANQGITGLGVSSGNTATPSIVVGNLHVGTTTYTYNIANTGSTGASLRGAVQDAANGASITDARLSGNGVVASDFGPIAPGASAARDIVVTIGTAGVYAPISGQAVSIVNNFENTRSQLLTIGSAAGAGAYNLAAAAAVAPNPVTLGNQRVGGTAAGALTIANTAPTGAFTEALNASFGTLTGAALTNGGAINQLSAGAANSSAMALRVDTTTAGAKTGTAQVSFASDGTGSSGLGLTSLAPQTITVSGNVYQLAAGQLNTGPLNFGTVQVGQTVSQLLSVTNGATGPAGFVEDLNVSFGSASGTGAAQISGTGSITGLLAGATNNSALAVNVNTATAGTINGAIAVNYFSAGAVAGVSNSLGEVGVGSSSYAVSGLIETGGQVINQAAPVINTPSIDLGNVRIGATSPTRFVSITNQATTAPPPQAALNASISGNAPITASGSFDLLAPGATNSTSLQVGMNTASAGAINGTATVALVSDANNVGGCGLNCQVSLASQAVNVTGAVYRLASPSITTGAISLAARIGDAAPGGSIGITNVSPDAFTERLNASVGAGPSGFATSGAVSGLAAGASSNAIGVALNTTTAGTFAGQVGVGFVSSGAGTTGAADATLTGQNVAVSGRVYAPAVAQINTTSVDFGIVHRGDTVTARNVSVTNAAAPAALNDDLRGTFGGATGAFTAAGTLTGLAAGTTDTSSFTVALNTTNAGVFNGSASAALVSHNPELTDLALSTAPVTLKGQVNNFAEIALGKVAGGASLTQLGNTYTLDFGNLLLGRTNLAAELGIFNLATGPADLLNGSFTIGSGSGFTLGGFDSFANIAAGTSQGGYTIGFGSAALGSYTQTITIAATGTNASGFAGALADTRLVLQGNVVAVPEPGTYALYASGLLALWFVSRRKLRREAR